MVIPYFYTEYRDDDAFSVHILEIPIEIVQYSHTEDVDDDVLTKPLSRVKFEPF